MTKTFSLGGIFPKKYKITSEIPSKDAGLPEYVYIPVKQHIGTPAKILVNKGDKVKVGTLLADADGVISADVHSSVSGEVIRIDETEAASGYFENMITIKVQGDEAEDYIDLSQTLCKEIPETPQEIIDKIRKAGVVGMGGAGYPTPIKDTIPQDKKIDILIINGIECEPWLTSDDRLMVEKAEEIVIGAKILNKLFGIQNAIIAIDENKLKAIDIISNITKRYVGVNVRVCKTKYPQGGEKQLISAITGREVPSGKLPMDIGCLVQNVGTVFAVYEAVMKNKPLYERYVTVSGDMCKTPQTFKVRIGTPISFLIDQCGGYDEKTAQIILGGPMMGNSIIHTQAPITKTSSGVLLLSNELSKRPTPTDCIRCGKCVDSCPMGLRPYLIGIYTRNNLLEELKSIHAQDCIECGCCAYICPARIPLLDFCKLAKIELKNKQGK